MKAITHKKYGSPEVLVYSDFPAPQIKVNEVLVKIRTSTVTSGDVRIRGFRDAGVLFWLPMRLMFGFFGPRNPVSGMEFSGTVVKAGQDVSKFSVGDSVLGIQLRGSNAEYTAIPQDAAIVKKPESLPYDSAAATPFGGIAALVFLRDICKVREGESVLIYGASGNVGIYAVQLCKYFGAKVTAVCSTKNLELIKSLGADKVLDYKKEDYSERQNEYNLIFDAVGHASFWKSRKALRKYGRFVTVGGSAWMWLLSLITKFVGSKRLKLGISGDNQDDLKTITYLTEQGVIKPIIDKKYPLQNIVEAHHFVESGHKSGSVIIETSEKLKVVN